MGNNLQSHHNGNSANETILILVLIVAALSMLLIVFSALGIFSLPSFPILLLSFSLSLLLFGGGLFFYQHMKHTERLLTNQKSGSLQENNAGGSAEKEELDTTKKAMLNIMEDMQEEKNAAESERAKDEAILGSVGDGLVVTDNNGKVLLINEVAADLLDVDQKASIAQDWLTLVSLFDEQGNPVLPQDRPIYQTLQSGKRVNQTFIYVKKNDKKVSLSITSTPVIQRDPVLDKEIVIGAIGIIRDITKEKEVDRMKTEFISLASHQLRTPLSAIRWFTEMLVGGDAGELNAEQKEFAKNIDDSTQRMIDLVNSLLNISRIESGRIMIDPKPTDLKELVEDIVKELRPKLTEKQQNLIISVHQELPKITIDPKLIRQVYLNLLTNAIKYTPNGGEISVFISKKGDEVVSQVTDNGYGIPKSQQAKIFQKFFRAENIIKVETDGTGLGLYLIKAIVESSHGKIWFESNEGEGTTFWFTLPFSGMVAKKGEVTLDS
jgi:signal transduction histidine kinase